MVYSEKQELEKVVCYVSALKTIYNLLQMNRKIENRQLRLLYLKDVWGMEQNQIAECERISQSYVSRELIQARPAYSHDQLLELNKLMFTGEEIQYIHFLPREIISDIAVHAFIEDILNIHPIHPFFQHYDVPVNLRIAALSSLGVQNKRLMSLFKKNQPTISMIVKRNIGKISSLEYQNRYDKVIEYRFDVNYGKQKNTFNYGGLW